MIDRVPGDLVAGALEALELIPAEEAGAGPNVAAVDVERAVHPGGSQHRRYDELVAPSVIEGQRDGRLLRRLYWTAAECR